MLENVEIRRVKTSKIDVKILDSDKFTYFQYKISNTAKESLKQASVP